jgi:hypothetical protein
MLTPSQKFEKELATRRDRCVLKGSFVNTSTTVTVNTIFMNPANLGQRPAAMAAIFSRFRLLKLVIKILPPIVSSAVAATPFALGVLDDTWENAAEQPTTINGIAALRCATIYGDGMTQPTEVTWNPVDPQRWFYTLLESAGSSVTDVRFTVPCVILFNVSTGSSVSFQVFYTLEFEGAISSS